jgi:hypothetical protein
MYFLMQKPVQTIKINTYFETDAMKTDSLIIFFSFPTSIQYMFKYDTFCEYTSM